MTGVLHMGHALDHTLQDILTRMKRMKGFESLWLPGMDHAGIATQNVVEKQLSAQGLSRHDLGREKFVEKVWQWKTESGGAILDQMKRLGDSVDWSRERFTMDEGLSRAVLTIFKKLYDQGLIYRAEKIINWCPRCLTALSDIEVEHSDDDGELVSIEYGVGEAKIVVATTRAETMLGDTAIAVHPSDPRYQKLVGTMIEMPITNRKIPVVADEHVDPEFGTGAVKVTPAHDPNDFEISQRHDLQFIEVLNESAVITGTNTEFDGLDRFIAREKVVEKLKSLGKVVKHIKPYTHSVGHCQRCDTTVEPRLSKQWFVKVAPLAKAASDAVTNGKVKIEPAELAPRYFDWVDNMHDWCISRQLWWGHRIPVYYGENGEIVVCGPDEKPPHGYVQDPDVLDTWFSSALWPFSTLGWPEQTADLKKFYPTSVLITGYDILFFWVARMMMFGLFAMNGEVPFHTIALHGIVRDQFGRKMSKSKGNVIDPLEYLDQYGADALRFTLAKGANPGSDQALAPEWIAGSRSFATKIWNATRFAISKGAVITGNNQVLDDYEFSQVSTLNKWILSRLDETVEEVDELIENFEFAKACDALFHFVIDDFCDWYIELSKAVIAQNNEHSKQTQRVLGFTLENILRLLHPIMPFITEELWCTLTGGESVTIANWPKANRTNRDQEAVATLEKVVSITTEIRRFRVEQAVKDNQRIPANILGLEQIGIADFAESIFAVSKLESIANFDSKQSNLTILEFGSIKIYLDLSKNVDVIAERARLEKDLVSAQKDLATAQVKLNNEGFMAKAPLEVVQEIRERFANCSLEVERIQKQLAQLPQK